MFTVPRNLSIEPGMYYVRRVCILQIRNLRHRYNFPLVLEKDKTEANTHPISSG